MGFVSSKSAATGPGVYGILVKPPVLVKAQGTGRTCLVEQFPWGPAETVYEPSDLADLVLTYFPPGMSRLSVGKGALAISGKGWPDPTILRVTAASGTVKASAVFPDVVPTTIITATLKFVGTAGNSVIGTVSDASDGVAQHFNLKVAVTGATGTTEDVLQNLNVSGTGADYLGADQIANLRLLGTLVKTNAGRPLNGSVTFSSGADGTVAATDYVGTIGTGDKGLSLTEGDKSIKHIFYGDPGNSFRAACNAGLQAHAELMAESRIAWMSGNSGQTAAAAQSDVASYRSNSVGYVDPWFKQISDQDDSLQTIPSAALAASVAAQLEPSTHISWRDAEVAGLMTCVQDVEFSRGNQANSNTAAGIITLIKKKNGGFAFQEDPNTNAPVNTTAPTIADTRIGTYILDAAEVGFESSVEGPNVPATQQPLRDALIVFMEGMVFNRDHDPAHNAYVKGYSLDDANSSNPQASLDNGDYSIPLNVKTDKGMRRIFIPMQIGPTVTP